MKWLGALGPRWGLVRMLWVAVLSLAGASGCAPDPLADCISVCDRQIQDGCRSSTTNCKQLCKNADVVNAYNDAAAIAKTSSCQHEFDAVYHCLQTGDVCSPLRCLNETELYWQCVANYCANHIATFCPN